MHDFAFMSDRATTFDETVISMMPLKHFAYLSVIAFLAACAPVEPKPVVTAPLPKAPQETTQDIPQQTPEEITEETPAKEIAPAETVPDTQAGQESAGEELAGQELPVENLAVEELAVEKVAEDNAREIADPIIAEAPKEEPAPPPPPPPYDPVTLIGESLQGVQSLFGTADLRFENGGLTISHYRQEECIMLVFSQNTDSALITHIDLRASQLGTALDTSACHQALGVKKHANQ